MAGIKALVIGMGVLLLAGFVVIVVTLINRVGSSADAEPFSAKVVLAPGERLADASLDGARVLLRIETATGARVEVRDLADGGLIGRFEVGGDGS